MNIMYCHWFLKEENKITILTCCIRLVLIQLSKGFLVINQKSDALNNVHDGVELIIN